MKRFHLLDVPSVSTFVVKRGGKSYVSFFGTVGRILTGFDEESSNFLFGSCRVFWKKC